MLKCSKIEKEKVEHVFILYIFRLTRTVLQPKMAGYERVIRLFRYTAYRYTVKFLNFGMPKIFAVIYLKFKQKSKTLRVCCQNGANGIANSEDPDQTAPLGAV